jgi:hypothetical protein
MRCHQFETDPTKLAARFGVAPVVRGDIDMVVSGTLRDRLPPSLS